ncbi:PEP/pyruvate-binding domain-containing protein [Bacillus sp. mrc49]|uniref:PEP/pyruvate-binding domain-containing protein n=1 Tax=Bacillus sp. mrc49 TaxID=2054913 RepID=UPI000C272C05|nr:PEP/pyruvate-binding domain-containing protein [Bacillus sp. mrc49]PJN89459.1 phosphotransferase [Bacillus sp. mrc49]
MYTERFNHATESREAIGAKADNLIKMKKLGLPVPDGFVISRHSFLHFVKVNELDLQSGSIQTEITQASIPEDLLINLTSAFLELREKYTALAVRSSSGAEDLEQASFAGQYETYLNVRTEEEFLSRVKECWASCFEARVLQYSKTIEEQVDTLNMGIVVQGLIHSDVSGVIFSQDPVTCNSDHILINASYGLGEAVVSGIVTPDAFVVKRDGRKIEKIIGSKELKIIPGAVGTEELETTKAERDAYCLDDAMISRLLELTLEVERHYQHPVDLEFGIQNQVIYLLQARPITTVIQAEEAIPDARKEFMLEREDEEEFWFLMDSRFPDPISPLFASIVTQPFYQGMAKASEELKEPMGSTQMKVHNGYYYGKQIRFKQEPEQLFMENEKLMEELYPELTNRMYDIVHDHLMPIYRHLDEETSQPFTAAKAKRGLEELAGFFKEVYYWHFIIVLPHASMNIKLEKMFQRLLGSEPSRDLYQSMAGIMNKSLESDRLLWQLSMKARKEPQLLHVIMNSDEGNVSEALSTFGKGKDFLDRVEKFVHEYGYRCLKSHDFMGETWVENHGHALGIIKNFIKNGYDFDKEFEAAVMARNRIHQNFLTSIEDPSEREEFEKCYQMTLDAAVITDDHHFYIDAMFDAKARLYLLKVGELLVQQGVLDDAEDIWFLYKDEIISILDAPRSLMATVLERKRQYDLQGKIKTPAYFGKPTEEEQAFVEMVFGSLAEDKENTANTMKGISASAGVCEGKVKVISGMHEASKFKKGDILVCKSTTPVWTSFFQDAIAIIADTGGMLSHSAIIAREYRIPAVLGTKIGTERLKDGDQVIVDGNTGTVTIIDA